MTTADRIRNKRLEKGMTQADLAKKLGLSNKAAVCKIEKQGNNVSLKNIERIAEALGCSVHELMGWVNPDEVKTGDDNKDAQLKRLVTYFNMLTNVNRNNAETYLKYLADQEKQTENDQ